MFEPVCFQSVILTLELFSCSTRRKATSQLSAVNDAGVALCDTVDALLQNVFSSGRLRVFWPVHVHRRGALSAHVAGQEPFQRLQLLLLSRVGGGV